MSRAHPGPGISGYRDEFPGLPQLIECRRIRRDIARYARNPDGRRCMDENRSAGKQQKMGSTTYCAPVSVFVCFSGTLPWKQRCMYPRPDCVWLPMWYVLTETVSHHDIQHGYRTRRMTINRTLHRIRLSMNTTLLRIHIPPSSVSAAWRRILCTGPSDVYDSGKASHDRKTPGRHVRGFLSIRDRLQAVFFVYGGFAVPMRFERKGVAIEQQRW